ncbi:aspartate--tRNA(Asn) ligase [Candidatus Saccharibacteria bacterium]|nr:aspartate--tRNA(Asn) ligase [Candidatus Saccharibacteria bacterium]MBI3337724.1 aspartate--tRNA(Asn) ligase [Candidatus Saccharibacteria bacterium]
MDRTLAEDVIKNIGKEILIEGWLHKKRLLGGLNFINIRDRTGLTQIVVEQKDEVEKLRGLQIGTILKVIGTVKDEPRAPGGAEIHDPKLEVVVPVTEEPPVEIDKPLSHEPENLDTLFEHRAIGLRNLQETKIFKIRSQLLRYIREFLYKNDFTEINTPKLQADAAEGGAEVFKLDYFGQEATLAQSPQLYKQIMVGVFERVFEIAPAFRAELSATTRHVSEVTMLDVEMGFIEGPDDVLNLVQDLVYDILTRLYKDYAEDLKSLNAPELKLTAEFPRYSMAEIHNLYGKANKKDMSQEIDLTPDEERWICEYAKKQDGCEAVFATGLPVSKMKFYHMKGEDETALSADLLFRGIEISTVPVREHRYQHLTDQMKTVGIDPNSPGFAPYVSAFKHGLPPHGGFGFGIDRLTEKTIGLANVKEAILFPRDINRLTP